jgi:methylated-DNA-[protein]-cysteine S-methyltransferase
LGGARRRFSVFRFAARPITRMFLKRSDHRGSVVWQWNCIMDANASGHLLFDTALGTMGIAWTSRGMTRLQLPGRDRDDTLALLTALRNGFPRAECAREAHVHLERLLPAPIVEAVAALRRYAAGERVDLSTIAIDLPHVAPFRLAVYRAARMISYGEVLTYGELAERAGHAGAFRETGSAMGANPVPLLVPCHRVLAAGRKLGGFSAPGGTASKLRLLALEGVRLTEADPAQASFSF